MDVTYQIIEYYLRKITAAEHMHRGGTTHSELGLPIAIINQENVSLNLHYFILWYNI